MIDYQTLKEFQRLDMFSRFGTVLRGMTNGRTDG